MSTTDTNPKNTILVHYEEFNLDIEVIVTPKEIADFLLNKELKHGYDELENSKDFTYRIIASSFADSMKELDDAMEISHFLGWYAIVSDCEEFYRFEESKHHKEAADIYLKKGGDVYGRN